MTASDHATKPIENTLRERGHPYMGPSSATRIAHGSAAASRTSTAAYGATCRARPASAATATRISTPSSGTSMQRRESASASGHQSRHSSLNSVSHLKCESSQFRHSWSCLGRLQIVDDDAVRNVRHETRPHVSPVRLSVCCAQLRRLRQQYRRIWTSTLALLRSLNFLARRHCRPITFRHPKPT